MIAIGCDHAALELKNKAIELLKNRGLAFKDYGCYTAGSVDYPDLALAVGTAVAGKECEKGILLCGTGIGMSIAANKIKGIRCAHCCDVFSAKATREHNDANVLAAGARILDQKTALEIIEAFLDTPFSNDERHKRRINKITEIENKY